MQYRDKRYAQGRILTMHILWSPAFTRLLRLGLNQGWKLAHSLIACSLFRSFAQFNQIK